MSKFHALLVGVNTYKNPRIRPLNGCVNDVERLGNYLKASLKDRLSLKTLPNEQASKMAVVNAFEEHLGKAAPGDTVLFYFSGHGCLEEVPPALMRHNNGRPGIETLCCYDTMADGMPGLADKELRYLIRRLFEKTQARIILMTDSCHSGGVTRNVADGTQRMAVLDGAASRLSVLAPKRKWGDFIFSKEISETEVSSAVSLDDVLPQGLHVHLAACASRQSAWEMDGKGIFTSGVLEVLQNSAGAVSFHDLHSRLLFQVRQRFDQSPELYVVNPSLSSTGDADTLRYETFLRGGASAAQAVAGVHWDATNRRWILDKGAIHGIPAASAAGKLEVTLLDAKGAKVEKGKITAVQPAESILSVGNASLQDSATYFQAAIKGLYLQPLNVWLHGHEKGVALLKKVREKEPQLFKDRNVQFVEDRTIANYQLLASANCFLIAPMWEPSDPEKARPVCAQTAGLLESDVRKVAAQLGAIAHWHFVQRLQNPAPSANWNLARSIRFAVEYQTGFAVKNAQGRFELNFEGAAQVFDCDVPGDANVQEAIPRPVLRVGMPKPTSKEQIPIVKIRARIARALPGEGSSYWDKAMKTLGLKTTKAGKVAHKPLHVGMLYLSQLYGVSTKIEGDVAVLEAPGEEVSGFGQNGVVFKVEDFIRDFDWKEETFFLKLVISTTPFALANLSQSGLEPPVKIRTRSSQAATKGELDLESNAAAPEQPDWLSKMVEIRLVTKP
ncbi:MAG: caspase family protein [Saprospiraceae bacterium]